MAATATPGTNSYIDVTDATTYFEDRYNYTLWAGITAGEQNQLLISATQVLDNLCDWYHYVEDGELAFGAFSPYPQAVLDSQCEIAYNILVEGSVNSEGDDPLTNLKAGSVELGFKAGIKLNPMTNDLVTSLLSPYGSCSGNSSTRVASMVRG